MKRCVFVLVLVACIMSAVPAYTDEVRQSDIIGEVSDRVYTNRTLGAELRLGDGWRVLSAKEIAALDNATLEEASSPTFEELTNGKLPAFYAVTNDFSDSIYITITNFGAGVVEFMANPDNRIIVDEIMEDMAKDLREANAKMGFETTVNTIRIDFLGREQPGLYIKTMLTETKPMYQKQMMCFADEYHFQVVVQSKDRDTTDELLAMFRKIN